MFPIQSRLQAMSVPRPAAPLASTDPVHQATFSYSSSSSLSSNGFYSPSTPPPTPVNTLLDISPRKSSFSSEQGAAYAFPSWPNRVSLTSHSSIEDVCVNSRLSDEDLLWMPENAGIAPRGNETTEIEASRLPTKEEQIQEELRNRANFRAMLEAHAHTRAAAHVLPQEKQPMSARDSKPKKRRVVPTPKRRAHSASKVMAQ